jgi:hypothetical protein
MPAIPFIGDARVGQPALFQTAAVATGNGTAYSFVGFNRLSVVISGITTATVTFEVSFDGTTYYAVGLVGNTGTRATTATADGVYMLPPEMAAGMPFIRARISAYTSGTITVRGVMSGPVAT